MAKVSPYSSGSSCQGMIELIRQVMDRFMLIEQNEQRRYLDRIAKCSGERLNEKKAKTEDPFEQIWRR